MSLGFKVRVCYWFNSLHNFKEGLIEPEKSMKWYKMPLSLLKFILFLLLDLIFLLIKIIIIIYESIKSFFFLLFCACKQLCKKTKKKFPRTGSGFLDLHKEKMTLVLDLDQTLIFSSNNKIERARNYAIIDNKFYVYKRPHLDDFLNTVSQYFELVVYTASIKEYADKVIDYLDKNKFISRRLYRSDCHKVENYYYKDVASYGYDERKLIIIDDIPNCHLKFRDNIIPIKSWQGQDDKDDSLLKLKNILKNYHGNGGVREIVNCSLNSDV